MRIVLAAALAGLLSFGASAQVLQAVPVPRTPVPMGVPPVKPLPSTTVAPAAKPAPPTAAAPAAVPAAAGPRVDVNGATAAQLDALPGIGPVRSAAIVAARPYTDLQELVTKKVLTQGVLDGAKGRMALANINTSSQQELENTLPGIGGVRAKAIIAGRPYATPQDLVTKKVLTEGVFGKMKDLVAY